MCRACYLRRFVRRQFELSHDAVNACIDATGKITFLKARGDVVADDCGRQAIGQHGLKAVTDLNAHFAFVRRNDQDCAIVFFGLALAILPDCPCATQSVAVIGYLIAFEAG